MGGADKNTDSLPIRRAIFFFSCHIKKNKKMKRTRGYREYTGEDIDDAPSRAKERRLEYDDDAVPETTLEWRMRDARLNPVVQCQTEIKRLEGINAHLVQQLGEARRECEATVGAIREHERRRAERQARMYIASEVRRLVEQHEQSRGGEMNIELRRLHNRLLRR